MDKEKVKQEIEELRQKLHQWEYEYYVLNNPSVDDFTYDKTLKQLIDLENQYPEFFDRNSPTQRIGGEVSAKFTKRKHKEEMLSLANSYNVADIQNFYNNIIKQTNQIDLEFVCEPKIDGLSISVVYYDGNFQYALTRGDGQNGEDVSNNVKTISCVPLKIDQVGNFEARGEVYLPKHVLTELNKDKQNFMNTRNTASGALRNLDPKVTKSRKLAAWFYYIPLYLDLPFKTHYEILQYLASKHFPVALDVIKKVKGIDGILQYIDYFDKKRSELDYDVDGVVIKLNDRSLYDKLGVTSKFPKYAIAYKYPPTIAQTRLLNIEYDVGRTGKINFYALLEPIKINGSTITYATLHNADYIKERDIRINDYVNIYKAAEVIPKISNPVLSMRDDSVYEFKIPTTCPKCNSPLIKRDGEVDIYCSNENCSGRILQKLIYYCSRDALDIEGLSDATIKKFHELGILNSFIDFYKLKDHKQIILDADLHIKDKMLNKILTNIENSKKLSLERILTALGIKFVGETTAKALAAHFLDIDHIINADIEQLQQVQDIGEKVANSIYEYFYNAQNIKLIDELKTCGVNFTYIEAKVYESVAQDHIYYNKTFVVTGKFSISRDELIQYLEQKYNATVLSNISKKTDYLVVGDKPSSKLQKAQELNIKILYEKDI